MLVPSEQNLEQSLAALKKEPALSREDFGHIVSAFAYHPDKARFLLQMNAYNEKLAEALLVFHKQLVEATLQDRDLSALIDQILLHYIINTDGAIIESEGSDPFDVFEAASRYADLLCVDVRKDADGNPVFDVDGNEFPCLQWAAQPGYSAAWSLRNAGPVINRARYGRDDVIPSYAFGFDENAPGHSLENAMTLADLAHLAYFKPAYVEKQLKAWGYNSFTWIENAGSDTQAFLAGKEQYLVLCFRGTSSWKDMLADMNFLKSDAYGGKGKVHRGFQNALDSVWNQVFEAIKNGGAGKKIFVCGHSLGAALAQLAAHRLALAGYNIAHIYVFGSPRVANREFMEHYNELLGEKTFLHINHKDIVTGVPLELLGFHHLGGPPRSFDNGHVITNVSASGEPDKNGNLDTAFDNLDPEAQEAVRQQMYQVEQSIRAATRFLTTNPNQLSLGSYDTQFQSGAADEHCMDQYLFKFACAIIDGSWAQIGKASPESK